MFVLKHARVATQAIDREIYCAGDELVKAKQCVARTMLLSTVRFNRAYRDSKFNC